MPKLDIQRSRWNFFGTDFANKGLASVIKYAAQLIQCILNIEFPDSLSKLLFSSCTSCFCFQSGISLVISDSTGLVGFVFM